MSDTRERLRREALKLFIANGYNGTSIADIERAAGLAPRTGGFYRHFSGKAALAAEIGAAGIIETREELGLDLLPLGDTRAELTLIAKGYLKASERQTAMAGLIAEVRHLPEIQDLERRVNEELVEALGSWLRSKPHAREKDDAEVLALLLMVFGGWIFYLSKRGAPIGPAELSDDVMLEQWAGYWASVLDERRGG